MAKTKKMKSRRSHGDGSVVWDCERSCFKAFFTEPNGKRISKRFKEENEAKDWLTVKRAEVIQHQYVSPSNMTLGEWILHYLTHYVKGRVTIRTLESYHDDALHLSPVANIPLQKIQTSDIQGLLNSLNMQGYSASVQRKVQNLAKAALKRAVFERILQFSPAEYLSTPPLRPKELITFTPGEIGKILRAAAGHPWELALKINALTGMRQSELLALRWEDINFTTGEIEIKRKLVATKSQGLVIGEPKTVRSKRKISLSAGIVQELKQQRNISGYLFTNTLGGLVDPSKYYKWYRELFQKIDVPYRPPNTLRHTHATILLQNNEPILEVASRLGHSNTSTTLNRYGHTIPGRDKALAQRAEELLGLGAKVGAK